MTCTIYLHYRHLCIFTICLNQRDRLYLLPSLKLTARLPLKNRPFHPKGKDRNLPTIHFQVLLLLVSGRVDYEFTNPNKGHCLEGFPGWPVSHSFAVNEDPAVWSAISNWIYPKPNDSADNYPSVKGQLGENP